MVGILNPWGDVWTYEVFDTPEEARESLVAFWRGDAADMRGFTCVGVTVTVAAISTENLWAVSDGGEAVKASLPDAVPGAEGDRRDEP